MPAKARSSPAPGRTSSMRGDGRENVEGGRGLRVEAHQETPVSLARLVMEKSGHVMMAGDGAEAFAKANGIELVDQKYFFTQGRFDALRKCKCRGRPAPAVERNSLLPIKIDMEQWERSRWIKTAISQRRLPPAARRTKKSGASVIHPSSAAARTRTTRPAPSPRQAMANTHSRDRGARYLRPDGIPWF